LFKVYHLLRKKVNERSDDFDGVLADLRKVLMAHLSPSLLTNIFRVTFSGHQFENEYHPSSELDYDALCEVTFDDEKMAFDTAVLWRHGNIINQFDQQIDQPASPVLATRIIPIKEAPISHIQQKMVCPISLKPGTTVENFRDYWRKEHSEVALRVMPDIHHYIQCHTLPAEYKLKNGPLYDGIAEFWFEDLAKVLSDAGSSPEAAEDNYQDQLQFMDTRDKLFLIVEPLKLEDQN